jgi:chorismate-pyruvate lyase
MAHEDLLELLARARAVLGRYLFAEAAEAVRDDVAEICMAIDDALPDESRVSVKRVELDLELEKSAA